MADTRIEQGSNTVIHRGGLAARNNIEQAFTVPYVLPDTVNVVTTNAKYPAIRVTQK
jgi:hypothetical protein